MNKTPTSKRLGPIALPPELQELYDLDLEAIESQKLPLPELRRALSALESKYDRKAEQLQPQ